MYTPVPPLVITVQAAFLIFSNDAEMFHAFDYFRKVGPKSVYFLLPFPKLLLSNQSFCITIKLFKRFLSLPIKIFLPQLHPLPSQVIELSPYFLPGFITQNRRGE